MAKKLNQAAVRGGITRTISVSILSLLLFSSNSGHSQVGVMATQIHSGSFETNSQYAGVTEDGYEDGDVKIFDSDTKLQRKQKKIQR